jgi:hypothetical protein
VMPTRISAMIRPRFAYREDCIAVMRPSTGPSAQLRMRRFSFWHRRLMPFTPVTSS